MIFHRLVGRDEFQSLDQVGSRVRKRIEVILDERSDILTSLQQKSTALRELLYTQERMLEKLDQLDEKLSQFSATSAIGIGHNNPPSKIEPDEFDIESATNSVLQIKRQINSDSPNLKEVEKSRSNLIRLGLKISIWVGSRITDFSKAAAIAAGTGFGVWATGLVPAILDTLQTLASYIQTLLI